MVLFTLQLAMFYDDFSLFTEVTLCDKSIIRFLLEQKILILTKCKSEVMISLSACHTQNWTSP